MTPNPQSKMTPPMNGRVPNPKPKGEGWTELDEATLDAMLVRRAMARKKAIDTVATFFLMGHPQLIPHNTEVVRFLISNAQKVRRLLEPFDSDSPAYMDKYVEKSK